MRILIDRVAAVLALSVMSRGQTLVPAFTADRILPSNSATPAALSSGMLISIYGLNLGPQQGCVGQAETKNLETLRRQLPTPIYPRELCGVQVFIGTEPAELLYVQETQINFKVPRISVQETVDVRVIFAGTSNSPVRIGVGPDLPMVSVDGVARIGGPVWIRVDLPYPWGTVAYPAGPLPLDFGCNRVEVRRQGVTIPPLDISKRMTSGGIAGPGNGCGNDLGVAGNRRSREGRLPLHLLYKFDQVGTYEVRYTRLRTIFDSEVRLQSAWTPISVQAARPARKGAAPQTPGEIVEDFLPTMLSSPDAGTLASVIEFLYHPDESVRRYAASVLVYWGQDEIDRRLAEAIRTKGPSDVVVVRYSTRPAPELIDPMLPYLQSENPMLLRGAIDGLGWLLRADRQTIPAEVVTRAESAILAATGQVLRVGDSQTISHFAATVGAVRDERARAVLWSLVDRGIQQASSVIACRKDLRDLPLLGALLISSPKHGPLDSTLSSIPNAMRNAYGKAALPFLQTAIQESGYTWVRTNCARELVLAGLPAGFAFIAQAIERNEMYKQEMKQFVLDRFPELRPADEQGLLAFLRQRAK